MSELKKETEDHIQRERYRFRREDWKASFYHAIKEEPEDDGRNDT